MPSDRARVRRHKRGDPSANGRPDPEQFKRFRELVLARRVDLVEMIQNGIPPREYHAHSQGILVRDKRHLVAAKYKVGKSLAWQAHLTRMALAGECVYYFDKENGWNEFARRLEHFAKAWELKRSDLEAIRANFTYLEFPALDLEMREALAWEVKQEQVDIVVFDSQRMILSSLGLSEDSSDEFSIFVDQLLIGLDCTVLTLDNTGHSDQKRGRGTSSKGDQYEVLFTMQELKPFDVNATGELALELQATRFDRGGPWTMTLGGGTYDEWVLSGPPPPIDYLILSAVPLEGATTQNQIIQNCLGQSYGSTALRRELDRLVEVGELEAERRGQGIHYWRAG